MASVEKTVSPSDAEKAIFSTPEADKALDFLRGQGDVGTVVDIDEKKLVRKIDWMIVP
jgi:hypothetical protein